MGREVLTGVFKFYDTVGLPISVVLGVFHAQGKQPCWNSFYSDALKSGWKKETIFSRLEEGIVDIYGKEYWTVVKEKLSVVVA
jgi:hypothetical protein